MKGAWLSTQLKVHPLSKFWFQMCFNLHHYAVGGGPGAAVAAVPDAVVRRRCRLNTSG